MTGGIGAVEAFRGGLSAVLGPEMLLVALALACGAAVAGSREKSWRADLVLACAFMLVVTAVWLRADLVPPARFSRWLALIPLLGLAEIRRLRAPYEDWMVPVIAVCTAGLVLFWRADRYGPVLATLRGDWQQPFAYGSRAVYHLGTGLGLALGLVLLLLLTRRLPRRARPLLAWGLLAAGVLLVVLDLVAPLQRWLLLHGPPLRVG